MWGLRRWLRSDRQCWFTLRKRRFSRRRGDQGAPRLPWSLAFPATSSSSAKQWGCDVIHSSQKSTIKIVLARRQQKEPSWVEKCPGKIVGSMTSRSVSREPAPKNSQSRHLLRYLQMCPGSCIEMIFAPMTCTVVTPEFQTNLNVSVSDCSGQIECGSWCCLALVDRHKLRRPGSFHSWRPGHLHLPNPQPPPPSSGININYALRPDHHRRDIRLIVPKLSLLQSPVHITTAWPHHHRPHKAPNPPPTLPPPLHAPKS